MKRPGRPFGVTLAIFASVCMFSILPLLQIGMILLVRQHFLNINLQEGGIDSVMMGGDFLGVAEGSLILQGVLAIIFLVIGVMAWRGKPAYIRFVMIAAVFGLTVIKLISIIAPILTNPNPTPGSSSLDGILSAVGVGQFFMEILVLAYVLWYMNRGPARAFFRGYYLTEPTQPETVPAEA